MTRTVAPVTQSSGACSCERGAHRVQVQRTTRTALLILGRTSAGVCLRRAPHASLPKLEGNPCGEAGANRKCTVPVHKSGLRLKMVVCKVTCRPAVRLLSTVEQPAFDNALCLTLHVASTSTPMRHGPVSCLIVIFRGPGSPGDILPNRVSRLPGVFLPNRPVSASRVCRNGAKRGDLVWERVPALRPTCVRWCMRSTRCAVAKLSTHARNRAQKPNAIVARGVTWCRAVHTGNGRALADVPGHFLGAWSRALSRKWLVGEYGSCTKESAVHPRALHPICEPGCPRCGLCCHS